MPLFRHRAYTARLTLSAGRAALSVLCPLLLLLLTTVHALCASPVIPLSAMTESRRLLPHMDALEDPSGTYTIEQVASASFIPKYTPLAFRTVDSDTGATWLRFTLEADKTERMTQEMLYPVLDLGSEQPGPVQLFVPHYEDDAAPWPSRWEMLESTDAALLPLPVPPAGTLTCYVRLAGAPGLWFHPVLSLRKATAPATLTHSAKDAVVGFAAALILLNLLLMAMGRGESRFWLALYGLLAMLHTISPVPPAPASGLPFSAAWAILTPGLALVLLPHVGRHILQTWRTDSAAESMLRGLSVFGAIIAVAPLVPGCGGLVRMLPLWPILALPLAIPAVRCGRMGIPGAKRYLMAILLTATGACLSLSPAATPDMARTLALLPFAGTMCGLLMLTPLVSLRQPLTQVSPMETPHPQTTSVHTIISRISHDLRTPLQAITHVAETLPLSPHQPQEAALLRTLQTATDNLSMLINDLLDMNRATKGRLHLRNNPFDLQRVLMEAHDIISPQAEQKGLQITWFMAPHLHVKYSGDADRMLQLLLILLGNAVRFSDQGTVALRVTRVPDSTSPGHLLFSIRDNGISIPLQNQYDVFENFCLHPESGKGRYGGSGMGLAIARELVGLMGGVMCLESTPGTGTEISFSVRLAALPGDAVADTPQSADIFDSYAPFSNAPAPVANHILVVDDVASNRQLVRFFLEGMRYTLTEARNGEEALEEYMKHPASVVVMDAAMPGIGGPQTVRAIREFESVGGLTEAPILALTARDDERAAMLDAGCTATLVKPLSRQRLLDVVTTLAPVRATPGTEETAQSIDTHEAAQPANTAPAHDPVQLAAHITEPSAYARNVPPVQPYPAGSVVPPSSAAQTGESPLIPTTLDATLVPLVPGLLANVDEALRDAHTGVRTGSPFGVQEACGRLAGTAASFGLRGLERMARCVERAAMADDLEAILDLLPDLDNMVRRNKRALDDIYRMHRVMAAPDSTDIL